MLPYASITKSGAYLNT